MPILPNLAWPELFLLVAFGVFSLLERLWPNINYAEDRPWYYRTFWLQVSGVVLTSVVGWVITDDYQQYNLIPALKTYFQQTNPITNGFAAYILVTFINYWWHRLRHERDLFWRMFHQIHHSTHRLQAATALYAHPFDYASLLLIVNVVAYGLLGFDAQSAAWTTAWVGFFELWEHTNVRTPRWFGYLVVRPEMHRIHHELDRHQKNYAIPIWDMLFGTYENSNRKVDCGFSGHRERRVLEMLRFKDVHKT